MSECDISKCELLKLKRDLCLETGFDEDFGSYKLLESFEPLVLTRLCLVDKSVIGTFRFRDVFICDSLENKDYLIQEGSYNLEKTYSPKFKRYLYEIKNVPHRSRLLIHGGNYSSDSKGCVLTGFVSSSKTYVNYSLLCLDKLMRIIDECSIRFIKILDFIDYESC